MGKLARTGSFTKEPYYECKMPWPEENCFVQCGTNGIVFTEGKIEETLLDPVGALKTIVTGEGRRHYRTAFFEAFPNEPTVSTFIRGEGATIEEAEESAWQQFQRFLACSGHEFEARGYTNGAGFCKHCGMFASNVIAPVHPCFNCGTPTWHGQDNQGEWWCEKCSPMMPEERQTDIDKMVRRLLASSKSLKEL